MSTNGTADRDLDRRFAEVVLGYREPRTVASWCDAPCFFNTYTAYLEHDARWKTHVSAHYDMGTGKLVYGVLPPGVSSNAHKDYAVLDWVRKHFTQAEEAAFGRALIALWSERSQVEAWSLVVAQYRIGDYARAAVAVKETNE